MTASVPQVVKHRSHYLKILVTANSKPSFCLSTLLSLDLYRNYSNTVKTAQLMSCIPSLASLPNYFH